MKKVFGVLVYCILSIGVVYSQTRTTVLEAKSLVPDWLISWMTGGTEVVEKLPQFKNKYIFISDYIADDLNSARRFSNKEIIHAIGSKIRSITEAAMDSDGNIEYYEFVDGISAYDVISTAKSKDAFIQDDYWQKVKHSATGLEEYRFYKLMAIDKKILDQKKKEFL